MDVMKAAIHALDLQQVRVLYVMPIINSELKDPVGVIMRVHLAIS